MHYRLAIAVVSETLGAASSCHAVSPAAQLSEGYLSSVLDTQSLMNGNIYCISNLVRSTVKLITVSAVYECTADCEAEVAKIVGAFGVPHTPRAPIAAQEDTPLGAELVRLYGEVAARVKATGPDVLVVFSTDHFNTFFSDLPIFSIGVAESSYGPCDHPDLPAYKVQIDSTLAKQLQHHAVKSGFDVAMSQEFALDHTFMVPYHFLARDLGVPIVPVFISGLVAPTPTSQRCQALGAKIREAIETTSDHKRVAILASGSFSNDLGGLHDRDVPDSAWVDQVVSYLGDSKREDLVDEATDDRMSRAGNIGGELLNWIAMLGTFDPQPPTFLERQVRAGHAYGAWNFEEERSQ